jgi:hypothetical protein
VQSATRGPRLPAPWCSYDRRGADRAGGVHAVGLISKPFELGIRPRPGTGTSVPRRTRLDLSEFLSIFSQ